MDSTDAIAALMSWAVMLSHYPSPTHLPVIEYARHQFFVEHACGGKKCGAIGWYDNQGTIYIDERLKAQDTVSTRGLIVHEMVHYLQDLSGKFDPTGCRDSRLREQEAYAIQREFIARAAGQAAFLTVMFRDC